MNELDFMIRELWNVVVDIEKLDIDNKKTRWAKITELRELTIKKNDLLDNIIKWDQ